MARTFADIQNEVLFDEFDPNKTVNGLSYRSLVKVWINEAAQHASREVQLPQLETEYVFTQAAGDQMVALPTTLQILTSLRITSSGARLQEVGLDEIDAATGDVGTPTGYALYGSSIVLAPTPGASVQLSMRYEGGLSDLSTAFDSDSLGWPEDFVDILVHYARSRAFATEDDLEMATYHRGLFDLGLARMRGQLQTRSRGRVRQIRGMMGPNSTTPRFQRP